MPELTVTIGSMLFFTGILAGVSNAVAGGGTFFTFPAFLAAGVPPVVANASNAVAIWPGHALALIGYRKELASYSRAIRGSIVIALLGGALGAAVLTSVGNQAFSKLIPLLIFFATLLFAFGAKVNEWVSARAGFAEFSRPKPTTRLFELFFSVYGGFFGAGLGIMLMAGLQMLGVHDTHANNALKNLLAAVITTVAVVILAASGLVAWLHTAVAFAGAILGGLIGGHVARRIPDRILRIIIVAFGAILTMYYFNKYYGV